MQEPSTPQPQPAKPGRAVEKDFDVAAVLGRECRNGIDMYRIRWRSALVSPSKVTIDDGGRITVEIGGVHWDGVQEANPIIVLEENKREVVWEECERPVWKLGKALGMIANFYENHPEEDNMSCQNPRFWKLLQSKNAASRPPFEAMETPRIVMDRENFPPERYNYTMPLLELCIQSLDRDVRSCTRLLNCPVQQPLKFSDQYLESGRWCNIERATTFRALVAYCVGTQVAKPCNNCAGGKGMFRKCVVENASFNGACTSCAALGGGCEKECEFHHACEYPFPTRVS